MRIAVVIVAAGSGSRFGGNLPKQFCLLAGKPVLMHTVERFRKALPHASVTLVVSANMLDFWSGLCAEYGFESPHVVSGGATRTQSVRNAVASIVSGRECPDVIMVHDGARPLVPEACILGVVEAMSDGSADGAIPAVPVTDSLRLLGPDGTSDAVDRARYRAVQTPQAFRGHKFASAVMQAGSESFSDDASLMEHAGCGRFVLTAGSPDNIKITNPADLAIAETILALQTS